MQNYIILKGQRSRRGNIKRLFRPEITPVCVCWYRRITFSPFVLISQLSYNFMIKHWKGNEVPRDNHTWQVS